MPLNNQNLTNKTTLLSVLESLRENINYNLNCVKVATVEEFFPENLTVSCSVANKRLLGLKENGNQILQDYPLIYAHVHFFGWGNIGATYPISKGMEGILLFNDRELETWFLTGQGGNLAYDRNHNLSDAIFICGVHSIPNMIEIMLDCLHLFYGESDIQIKNDTIIANTDKAVVNAETEIDFTAPDFKITGNTTSTGTITSASTITGDVLIDTTAATGTFTTADSKIVTVENGIIRSITGGS